MFLDEDKISRNPKARESRAMFLIAMSALAACVVMVIGLMSPPDASLALDHISTSGIEKPAANVLPAKK